MNFNISEEVYKLKINLIKTVGENPLPVTVKLMVVNELVAAMGLAETNEIKNISAIKQTKATEGSQVKESER